MQEEIKTIYTIISLLILLIAAGMVVLFILFNNRKNKLIKEKLESSLTNQKRQYELQLQALRGQMNPHFVHNSLNAIQYYIQQSDVETSEEYLAKFSKLMRQFFDYSRQHDITLKEELSLLNNYLEIEKLRFEEKLNYTINVDSNLDIEEEYIPSMILQPLVENAINHGVFHKEDNGHITIHFNSITEETYKVEIIDNGVGIKKSKQINSVIKKNTGAHSSEILKERLHFLNESSNWNVEFYVKDRSENTLTTGTTVTLLFTKSNTYEN